MVSEESKKSQEKEKEKENIPPISPNGESDRFFDAFWKLYPRKVGKTKARKAWDKLKPDHDLMHLMGSGLRRQMNSPQWQEEGGRFIPHPATWLNQRRWEDEITPNLAEIRHTVLEEPGVKFL